MSNMQPNDLLYLNDKAKFLNNGVAAKQATIKYGIRQYNPYVSKKDKSKFGTDINMFEKKVVI